MWASLLAKLGPLLSGPASWVLQMVLQFGLQKIVDYFKKMKQDADNAKAAKEQAQADMQKAKDLKPDSSVKDQEAAADDAFKHL